ncbi:hypothetical protein LXL04_022177 [Taraxacum kok-saghyz]
MFQYYLLSRKDIPPSHEIRAFIGVLQLDLDSEDETLREDSEIALKQELAWASHLSLQACLLPTPKGRSCGNYARCVNQILQNLNNMQLWLRIPLEKSDGDDDAVLIEWSSLPYPNSLGRWIGEPVKSAILHTDSFLTNARGYPCLSKRHQNLLNSFFYYSVQIVFSGKAVHKVAASGATQPNAQQAQRHELRSYLEPLPEQERFEPLMDNLEAQTYETFEKDSVKYIQVLMVVGAGRGPLVRASLQVKLHKDLLHFETAYVVKLHRLAKLSPSQSVSFLIL